MKTSTTRVRATLVIISIYIATVLANCDPTYPYRSIDGSCNTLTRPNVGKALNVFSRLLAAQESPYNVTDGDDGNARNISNILAYSPTTIKNTNEVNMLETLFGQFLTHDVANNLFIEPLEQRVHIPIYPGDSLYRVNATNNYIIATLSDGIIDAKTEEFEIYNNNTSWFDLSTIYDSNLDLSNRLRSFIDGKLKTSTYFVQAGPVQIPVPNLPPSSTITGIISNTFFSTGPSTIPTAGDNRGNENIGLFSISTVFWREHNRIATALASSGIFLLANGSIGNLTGIDSVTRDTILYEEARRRNIAQYQKIVFVDYPPIVLGHDLKKYNGYKRNSGSDTPIEFASAAFRYGHSSIGQWDLRNATTGCIYNYTIPAGVFGPFPIVSSQLPNAGQLGGPLYPASMLVLAGGIENVLRGLLNEPGEMIDLFISDPAIRTVKFAGSIGAGIDIFSFDLVRCRSNKCPYYYDTRKKYYKGPGPKNIYTSSECQANRNTPTDPLDCFLLINPNITIATNLRLIYGKINRIELLVGLLAEATEDNLLPPTMAAIVESFYEDQRDGDRFFYLNQAFSESELNEINQRTLADIIADNTNLKNIQANAFQVPTASSVAPKCAA